MEKQRKHMPRINARNTSEDVGLSFRMPSLAEALAIGVTVLYVLGFVVANAYYARFELVRFDLLRGRYVAAALLLAFCSVFPIATGWLVGWHYRDSEPKPKRERQLTAALVLTVVTAVSALLVRGLLFSVSLHGLSWLGLGVFTWASATLGATIGSAACKFQRSDVPARSLRSRGISPGRLMSALFVLVAMANTFGQYVYPFISPAYGGGAGTLATVVADSQSVDTELREALSRRAVILDRDEHFMNLLACVDADTRTIQPVSLPTAAIRSVILEGLIAAPSAGQELCSVLSRR